MSKGLFLLERFNAVNLFNDNKNEVTAIVVSIVKLHENTRFNITKGIVKEYMLNEYKLNISRNKIDNIYEELKNNFKIKNLEEHHEFEDLYFEIKKIFPILKLNKKVS